MNDLKDALRGLVSTQGFVPRRYRGVWPDWLVWEHVAGNTLVWLAYMVVPLLVWRLVTRKRQWGPFREVILAFACFILLRGLGHFLDMLAFFRPMYRLSGHVLVLTGITSFWTIWALRRAWPTFLAMKSPAELERQVEMRTEELSRAIGELKRADVDRAHLATIVESSDDAIIGKNLDGVITSWNAGAERIFGYSAAETLGRSITMLLPPDRADEEPAILARLRAGERVDHFESVRVVKGGRRIDVSLTISPIKDPFGRIVGISKIARDITESKQVDEALRESEGRFRALTEILPQLVWSAGPEGIVEYVSPQWFAYTGLTDFESVIEQWSEILHPEDRPRFEDAWDLAKVQGDSVDIELRIRRHDGVYRWFKVAGVAIRGEDGRVDHWFGACTDIHEAWLHAETAREAEACQRRALSAARLAHWE